MDEAPVDGEGDGGEKALRCPVCGWMDVRRSMPKGFVDALVRMVGLVPYRCRSCGLRFYRGKQDTAEPVE